MANFRSTQLALLDLTPQTALNSSFSEGKVRIKCFDWTGDAAQNDTVEFCTLPKGARIISGRVDFDDMGTSITLSIGDGTTAAKYLSALDVATAAGQSDFANTWALYGLGREALASNITLTGTLGGGNPGSGSIRGWIKYVVE